MSLSYFDKESINFVENLDFFANQVVEGFLTGLHKSPFHGFSVEFAEHRMYNNGDSIKNIDWKLFARSDKLFVKRFEEETNLRCHLVIDSSSSMYFPLHLKNNKLNFSLLSSACLMNLFRRQRDAFGITFFSDEVNFHSEAKLSKKHYLGLKKQYLGIKNYYLSTTKQYLGIHSLETFNLGMPKRGESGDLLNGHGGS